jgi:hypothetical protein
MRGPHQNKDDELPRQNSGFPILPGELNFRFGCGAVFGLVTGFIAVARWTSHPTWLELIGYMVGNALICGWLARMLGDDFWRDPRNW